LCKLHKGFFNVSANIAVTIFRISVSEAKWLEGVAVGWKAELGAMFVLPEERGKI
jgi:hypothetical protein